jgi:hypothetical protein
MEEYMSQSAVAAASRMEEWRRLGWRLQALDAGFSPEEANRLAFWRWQAAQRGETSRRAVTSDKRTLRH